MCARIYIEICDDVKNKNLDDVNNFDDVNIYLKKNNDFVSRAATDFGNPRKLGKWTPVIYASI